MHATAIVCSAYVTLCSAGKILASFAISPIFSGCVASYHLPHHQVHGAHLGQLLLTRFVCFLSTRLVCCQTSVSGLYMHVDDVLCLKLISINVCDISPGSMCPGVTEHTVFICSTVTIGIVMTFWVTKGTPALKLNEKPVWEQCAIIFGVTIAMTILSCFAIPFMRRRAELEEAERDRIAKGESPSDVDGSGMTSFHPGPWLLLPVLHSMRITRFNPFLKLGMYSSQQSFRRKSRRHPPTRRPAPARATRLCHRLMAISQRLLTLTARTAIVVMLRWLTKPRYSGA